ncbi:hypothetical protein BD408DRAFT_28371 [Parasitella parasitica]|nr:hypothetical protein BD408DRAFT_28371 [Parasitella parasitica]
MTLTSIANESREPLVGHLIEKSSDRVVLIIHGEQGHKDGLYQAELAEGLPFTSFRFDLSGNGESEGEFDFGRIIAKHTADIHAVARHFENLGYQIFAIIAYGLGSLSGLKYATTCDKPLAHYINIAAPFDIKEIEVPECTRKENWFQSRSIKMTSKAFVNGIIHTWSACPKQLVYIPFTGYKMRLSLHIMLPCIPTKYPITL